jgi:hypothetical protein
MPTIKFTHFSADFSDASEAGAVIKTVLQAAGFQTMPDPPKPIETQKTIAAPVVHEDKPRRKYGSRRWLASANGREPKAPHPNSRISLSSQEKLPVSPVIDAGKKLTVSAAIRMVLGKGPMAARQVFHAVLHAGLTTAFPTVQSLLYQAEKHEWVTRSEGGIYAITEKGRNQPR